MDVFLSACWYLFLLIVCIAMDSLTQCFSKVNIFTFFVLFFMLNHGIGIPSNLTVNADQIDLVLPEEITRRWIIGLVIMYVSFIVGVLIAKYFSGNKNINIPHFKGELSDVANSNLTGTRKIFIFVAIITAAFTFVQLWNPNLIIQSLYSSFSAEDYKSARIDYGENYNSLGARIANTLKFSALPLMVNISFGIRKINQRYSYLFYFLFTVLLILHFITGQKAGIGIAVLGVMLCQLFESGNIYISIKNKSIFYLVSAVLIIFFALLPVQYMFQYSGIDYQEALGSVINRVTAETSRTLQLHFYVYPDKMPHLYGASSAIISGLFGDGQNLDPGRVVRSYIAFSNTTDATGSWGAAFIGTAWADFGYIGVAIESAMVTILLWCYHQWFINQRKTPLVIAMYASLSISSTYLTESNLLTTLFSFGLGLNFIFYFLLREIQSKGDINASNVNDTHS